MGNSKEQQDERRRRRDRRWSDSAHADRRHYRTSGCMAAHAQVTHAPGHSRTAGGAALVASLQTLIVTSFNSGLYPSALMRDDCESGATSAHRFYSS